LDRTANLLRRFSAGALMLSLADAPLPPGLADRVVPSPPDDPRLRLHIDDYEEIEGILAALRLAGCRIEEMEIAHTDLEDVFVGLMRDGASDASEANSVESLPEEAATPADEV